MLAHSPALPSASPFGVSVTDDTASACGAEPGLWDVCPRCRAVLPGLEREGELFPM